MNKNISQFINKTLPGNYWITKSMEFTKIQTSGTLWYLKKWIVYYQYIFFRPTLNQQEYNEIVDIFKNFIDSLPHNQEVKDNAKAFFFNINIEDADTFIHLNDFLNNSKTFTTEAERQAYILNAKKFYFTYIMNIGGQSGYKKDIKEIINEKNSYEETLKKLKNKLKKNNDETKFNELVNDFHATLRNERQIFFYYGFFHGKESADLSGFYNLTNIGKSIITSTFDELLLIWEHQKLKMISQSPITDIQNLENCSIVNTENFSIDYHPYISLLQVIFNNNAITTDEYHYVISKIDKDDDLNFISENLEKLEEENKAKVKTFNRTAEIKSEDFRKELIKYILGISELPKDAGTNPFTFLTNIKSKKISILEREKATFILKNYIIIKQYLDSQYLELYKTFEEELKKKYANSISKKPYVIDISVKYEWSKYIINFDKSLYLSLIYLSIALKAKQYSYNINVACIKKKYNNYENILKSFGIKKKSDFVNLMIEMQSSLFDNKIYIYEQDTYDFTHIEPRQLVHDISMENLKTISHETFSKNIIDRKRSTKIIQAMKSFYYDQYKVGDLINCDCCGESTFLTTNKDPYIEFHHLIPFSTDNGPDHYLNLFGLCPMCHRKMHFLNIKEKENLYNNLSTNNNMMKTLSERINELFNEKILEPIHLEFLLKEKIITEQKFIELMNQEMVA